MHRAYNAFSDYLKKQLTNSDIEPKRASHSQRSLQATMGYCYTNVSLDLFNLKLDLALKVNQGLLDSNFLLPSV